jgi:hypothetical protein
MSISGGMTIPLGLCWILVGCVQPCGPVRELPGRRSSQAALFGLKRSTAMVPMFFFNTATAVVSTDM